MVPTNSNEQVVHLIEGGTADEESTERGEQLYLVDEGSIRTDELPSTIDTSEHESLLYANNQLRKSASQMVRPKQVAFQDENTTRNRPGWEVTKQQIICYLCYEIGTHISPRCTDKLNDMDLVVANYEKLTDEQKKLVPDDSYKLAKRYLDMRHELSNMNRKNEHPAEDSSKN